MCSDLVILLMNMDLNMFSRSSNLIPNGFEPFDSELMKNMALALSCQGLMLDFTQVGSLSSSCRLNFHELLHHQIMIILIGQEESWL